MSDGTTQDRALVRPAGRVLLIDERERVALMRAEPEPGRVVWITPGGGLEAGERYEDAALRELREELGVHPALIELSPCVWIRRHVWYGSATNLWYDSLEHFFVARVVAFELAQVPGEEPPQWWTLEDIEQSHDLFAPRQLARLARPLLRGQFPDAPLRITL